MAKPAGGPKLKNNNPNWDEDWKWVKLFLKINLN